MNLSDPTPNEVQAAIIADLEAKLSLASEREFYIKAENARLRALFPAILAALRNGGCCTTDVSVEFLECVPNEVASVVSRLRADIERFTGHGLLDCHAICDQRDAAVAERDSLRAEVDRLKGALALGQQNCDDAYDDLREERDDAIAKRERAEAELTNIANAKPDTWGDMSDSFQAWAQNRARHALAAMKGTP